MGARNAAGFTLVLGGGGIPGLAYLAGALTGLDRAGLDPAAADLVIGTSAGALVGALLRAGCPLDELAATAAGSPVLTGGLAVERAWRSGADLFSRAMGAAWVLGRSTVRVPWPLPPPALGRLFPGALFAPRDTGNIDGLPRRWPVRPLWAVTVDLRSGRRVVLGADAEDLTVPLGCAVRASTAVPGVLAPVRFRDRVLVDGGVHSTTNLDLAAGLSHLVVCVAPLAYDSASPPGPWRRALRLVTQTALARESRAVRARRPDARLLLIRPDAEQVRNYPVNFLRADNFAAIEEAARRKTLQRLQAPEVQALLRGG